MLCYGYRQCIRLYGKGYSEFFNWQIYDAFSLLADIMQSAGKCMIGNYACVSTLNLPQKKRIWKSVLIHLGKAVLLKRISLFSISNNLSLKRVSIFQPIDWSCSLTWLKKSWCRRFFLASGCRRKRESKYLWNTTVFEFPYVYVFVMDEVL